MNDDSIAKHMYCHVLSVLLTGQKKKKKKQQTEQLNPNKPQTQVTVSKIQNNYHKCYFIPPTRIIGYGRHLVWNPGEPAKQAPNVDIHVMVSGDWCSFLLKGSDTRLVGTATPTFT